MCIRDSSSRSQKKSVDVRQELNIMSTLDKVAQYRLKCLEHLNRTDDTAASRNYYGIRPKAERTERRGSSEEALE